MPAPAKKQKPPKKPSTTQWHAYAGGIAIVILYIYLRLPGIAVPLDRDEGAFGYIGQVINRGGLPYREALDHKPPVAFYLNAFALHFIPPTEQGIHWFLLIYNFTTLVCLFFVAKIYFKSMAAGLWTAFTFALISASPAIQGFTASTEMWALLPIALSLLLAAVAIDRANALWIVASGAAGAVACWTKQTAFASILFVLLAVVFAAFKSRQWVLPVAWLAGAIGFSAIVMGYFAAHGIFDEFVYWCFRFAASYAGQAPLSDTLHEMRVRATEIMTGDGILVLMALGTSIWAARKGQWLLAGFLALSLAGTIPGYTYRHYFSQLAPAMALAAGYGLWQVADRKRIAALSAAAAMIALPLIGNAKYFFEPDPNMISGIYFGLNPFPESKAIAEFVAERTKSSDTVLVVGSEPQILFYADRPSASSFVMLYPLMSEHPRYREFQDRLWEEAKRTKPKYVLAVLHLPFSLGWDQKASIDVMRTLEKWLGAEYDLEAVKAISGSEGAWLRPGDPRLQSDDPFVYVFKRNMSAGFSASRR